MNRSSAPTLLAPPTRPSGSGGASPSAQPARIDSSDFPELPPIATHILRLSERRMVGFDELAALISRDLALANSVIRAVNSNFYGLRRRVTTVRQAVATLGLQSMQTLVLGQVLSAAVPDGSGEAEVAAFWRRCVCSAAAARSLAARFLPAQVEDCFIAALLMDLGTLVLDQAFGTQYSNVVIRAKTHAELAALETVALEANHADVGAMLLRHWGLPAALEVPVGAHHSPQKVESQRLRAMAEILEVASRCAEVFLADNPAEAIMDAREALSQRHNIAVAEADKILARVGQKAAELAPLLRVSLKASDYHAILERATPRLLELALGRRQARTTNQRRSQRLAREGTLALYPCTRGTLGREVRVRLRDLSGCGIGILNGKPMSRGSQFVICLPQPGGSTKSLLYTAVRCEPAGSQFLIGAELRSVLRSGEGQGEIDSAESSSACGAD